ncbi:MAG: DUF4974 domain-containing protein [Bacteroidaceae bacterium]|nr:DUF4974 domain-containing protein [Bacteroidaceae bacterium]
MEKNKRHEDYALRQVMGEQARQAEKLKLSDGFADRVMQRVMEKSGEREVSHWSPLRKIAAAVAVILTISGIAYAAYSAMSVAGDEEVAVIADVAEEKTAPADSLVRFEGQMLDKIMHRVASHYGRAVRFRNEELAGLRLSTVWNSKESLSAFVETLNEFDGLRLTDRQDTIFVESGKVED